MRGPPSLMDVGARLAWPWAGAMDQPRLAYAVAAMATPDPWMTNPAGQPKYESIVRLGPMRWGLTVRGDDGSRTVHELDRVLPKPPPPRIWHRC
jgi:hypothetical protein